MITEPTSYLISPVTDFLQMIPALAKPDYDDYLFTKTSPFEAKLESDTYSPEFCVLMNAFDTYQESPAETLITVKILQIFLWHLLMFLV